MLSTFQVPNSHMGLVASVRDKTDIQHCAEASAKLEWSG